jgi:hypothetical protein
MVVIGLAYLAYKKREEITAFVNSQLGRRTGPVTSRRRDSQQFNKNPLEERISVRQRASKAYNDVWTAASKISPTKTLMKMFGGERSIARKLNFSDEANSPNGLDSPLLYEIPAVGVDDQFFDDDGCPPSENPDEVSPLSIHSTPIIFLDCLLFKIKDQSQEYQEMRQWKAPQTFILLYSDRHQDFYSWVHRHRLLLLLHELLPHHTRHPTVHHWPQTLLHQWFMLA